MNLNRVVGGITASINPRLICQYQASTGYTVSADGTQIPTYATAVLVLVQVQPLSSTDLRMLDALNLQGNFRAMYVDMRWQGINRAQIKGGDLITEPDGTIWLVTTELEAWSASAGWTKVAVTQQNIAISTNDIELELESGTGVWLFEDGSHIAWG